VAARFFPQGVAVLFEQAPFGPALQQALAPFDADERPGTAQHLFASTWAIPFRPELGGAVLVDALPRAWPDAPGDPETDGATFLARGAGAFGPGAWPGGLRRAAQGSPEADAVALVERHRGVVRVRFTYALDLPDDAPLAPAKRDAVDELAAVLEVAQAVLGIPGALAFYNPNAEVLVTPASFARAAAVGRLPWPLVISVRNLPLEQPPGAWLLDTLGLGAQFDGAPSSLRDHEVLLEDDRFAPAEVDRLLRGLSATAITRGHDWQAGDQVDGPGGEPWIAQDRAEALVVPPRPVWRWSPASQVGLLAPP
jgi:hypothetical protein